VILAPIFSIELHIKDLYLLEKIQDYFKVGTIIIRKRDNRTTAIYFVQSIEAINNIIIPHFLKYLLITKKQKDFKLFCLIFDIFNKKEHLTLDGIKKIISIRGLMNKSNIKNFTQYFEDIPSIKVSFNNNNEIINPY